MIPEKFLKEIVNLYSKTQKKTNNDEDEVLSDGAAQVAT